MPQNSNDWNDMAGTALLLNWPQLTQINTNASSFANQDAAATDQSQRDDDSKITGTDGKIEERVQVDRRKLEQMIIARSLESNSNEIFTQADAFFSNIMHQTNTLITWPTKLKVGAKTKKDPFVKISGHAQDVERAKKLILNMLETRHNRVTIKIDVAFTDHSHIIGKQGRNTQLAMKQTSCHIHFPDSNRNPDLEKSNMVSIAGPMQTVDQARRILRELAPLVITLETKNMHDDPLTISEDPLIRELSSNSSGISVLVRSNRSTGCPVFIIRGSVYQASRIRSAALSLQQRFMNTTQSICTTTLEILQQQHTFVLGPQNVNIQLITQRTGAQIQYPIGENLATTFLIQGTIDAVLNARKHLVGCLPMSFVFESQSDVITSNTMGDMEKQYGLSINMRPKRNGDARNIVVKGQERQATAMYEIRRRFMNADEPQIIASDFEFMRDFDVSSLMRPSQVTRTSPLTVIPQHAIGQSISVNAPMISPVSSPGVFGFSSFYSTSPFSPLPIPDQINNQYFDTLSQFNPITPMIGRQESQIARQSPEIQALLNYSTPVTRASNDELNSNDPVPEEAPLASGLLEAAKKIQENSNNWKAPGAERGSNMDYDQQKLMATKVMQEKALGLRVPNQQWSGLGFSRSMPAPILRQFKSINTEKSIDFGESSASSSSSGALPPFDEDEEDKIGPWPLETRPMKQGAFNATTYFDSVQLPRPKSNVCLSEIDDMATLLSQLHLTKYVDTFREQEVDMNAFLTMTDADLKELGVNTFGARRKLLVAISEIKEFRRHFR